MTRRRTGTSLRLLRGVWLVLWLPMLASAQPWGLKVADGVAGDGVELTAVTADSPAARAGLRAGDRVLAVQGRPTRTAAEVAAQVQALAPGMALELRISRDGWERSVALAPQAVRAPGWLGATVAPAASGMHGIVVTEVAADGPARQAGVKPGDILLAANGRELGRADDLMGTLAGLHEGDMLTLAVSREGWEKRVAIVLQRQPDGMPAARPTVALPPPSTDAAPKTLAELAAAADLQYARQDWAQAERLYRAYVGQDSREPKAWERLGHSLLMQGRYADAVDACSKAIELAPSAAAWNNIGLSLLRLGKTAGARSAYLRAIELAPDLSDAHLGLGSAYLAERNWDKAREQLEYVADHDPGNAAAIESLAGTYSELGRWSDAANAYRRAMALGASATDLNYALAWSLYQADRPQEARGPLEDLLRAQPGNAKALVLYGHVLTRLGDAAAARTAWDRAAQIDPRSVATAPSAAAVGASGPASPAPQRTTPLAAPQPLEPQRMTAGGAPVSGQAAKAAIAVGDFQVKAAGASAVIGDGMREMLVTGLFGSGKYVVVERIDVPGLAAEQALSRSGMARPGSAIAAGQMDVADILIYGAVTEFLGEAKGSNIGVGVAKLPLSFGLQSNKAHMAIDVRVVDVASGRILGAQRIVGEAGSSQTSIGASPSLHGNSIPLSLGMYSNTPMEQAIRACVDKAIAYVGQTVPGQYYHHQ